MSSLQLCAICTLLLLLLLSKPALPLSEIPVYVICFNRFSYVRAIVDQLRNYTKHIILLDNNSTQPQLLDFYSSLMFDPVVKVSPIFDRHHVPHNIVYNNMHRMPDIFALTDPDLRFRRDIPHDFLDTFAQMTEEFKIVKVGCALNITGKLRPLKNSRGFSIVEWEQRFWDRKLQSKTGHECYDAWIDTTMAVYNKKYFVFKDRFLGVRVAGLFTAEHLPWRKVAVDEQYYIDTKRPDSGVWVGEKPEFRIENYYLDETENQ